MINMYLLDLSRNKKDRNKSSKALYRGGGGGVTEKSHFKHFAKFNLLYRFLNFSR